MSKDIQVRTFIFIVLFLWGFSFITGINKALDSILHFPNLIFHEAGHVLFIPFGRFMTILGGSLMQLIVPGVVYLQFLFQKDKFAASVGLWWLGQNFLDIAPYVEDAKEQKLPLITGGTGKETGAHDWNNLLGDLNLIDQCYTIANIIHIIGCIIILYSLYMGAKQLYLQWRNSKSL